MTQPAGDAMFPQFAHARRLKNYVTLIRLERLTAAPLAHPQVASVIPAIASVAQLFDTLRSYRTSIPLLFWEDLKSAGLLREDAVVPRVQSPPQTEVSTR